MGMVILNAIGDKKNWKNAISYKKWIKRKFFVNSVLQRKGDGIAKWWTKLEILKLPNDKLWLRLFQATVSVCFFRF